MPYEPASFPADLADLAEVIEAWPGLAGATRAAILAMVRGEPTER